MRILQPLALAALAASCQLSSAQVPQRAYWEAKAQCWADLAAAERSQGDTHGTSATAQGNASRIEAALKEGRTPAPTDEQPIYSRRILPSASTRDGRPTWLRDILQIEATVQRYNQRTCRTVASACLDVAVASVYENMEESVGGRWNHGRPEIDHALALAQKADARFDADCPPAAIAEKPVLQPIEVQRTLSADALFAFDSARLTDEGRRALVDLASSLPDMATVRVVGHTDRFGSAAYNARLSQRRAEAVRQVLQAQAPRSSIAADGVGSTQPVIECPGAQTAKTIQCLAPNRRVVVSVKPQGE